MFSENTKEVVRCCNPIVIVIVPSGTIVIEKWRPAIDQGCPIFPDNYFEN